MGSGVVGAFGWANIWVGKEEDPQNSTLLTASTFNEEDPQSSIM